MSGDVPGVTNLEDRPVGAFLKLVVSGTLKR